MSPAEAAVRREKSSLLLFIAFKTNHSLNMRDGLEPRPDTSLPVSLYTDSVPLVYPVKYGQGIVFLH